MDSGVVPKPAMNPFQDVMDARAYDAARPYFHPLVFKRLARVRPDRFPVALDVACGTGQSTQALAAVSAMAVGLDASVAMLRHARRRDVIPYVRGQAESLPFPDSTFDIVTVGLGLHWFDRVTFLSEARRVLRPGAWLLVYDSGFCERMLENPAFSAWVQAYREQFPAPPRNDAPMEGDALERAGFKTVLSDTFVHREVYDLDQLVSYLKTQSNVLMQLRQAPEAVVDWLRGTLRPFFVAERATLEYQGWMLLLQRGT